MSGSQGNPGQQAPRERFPAAPTVRSIQTNFTAGEISPRLYGRIDLDRYSNGAAEIVNMTVRTQGGAGRRTGSYFVAPTKTAATRVKLYAFEASEAAAYILEFGAGYVRFFRNRGAVETSPGVPLELATPYAEADLRQLRFAQSADVLFICHPSHQPRRISRLSATSFAIGAVVFTDGPWQDENTGSTTLAASATVGGITVTASAATFTPDDLGRLLAIRDEVPARAAATAYGVGTQFHAIYNQTSRLYQVVVAGTTAAAAPTAGIEPPWDKNAPVGENDTTRDGTAVLRYLGRGKALWGYGLITAVGSATSVSVAVRDPMPSTVAAPRWRLGEWAGARGWPRCMTFHAGRTVWAGSVASPQTVWFSETGAFFSMSPSEMDGAVLDTNGITYTLDDDRKNTIQWLSSFTRGLLAGSPSGEFVISAPNASNAISPSNFEARRKGDRGSSALADGIRVGSAVLYLSRSGRKLREFSYDFGSDSYKAPDLTVLSEHITGTGVVEYDYQEEPEGIAWLVRDDGALLSLTYDQEQQVRAWCRHSLGGTGAAVESVAVVADPAGSGEDVYVVVRRTVLGATVRYIEWIGAPFDAPRDGATAGFFVDAGLTYAGAPTLTFSGLKHLAGETVAICADGATRPLQVVPASGTITIPEPAASRVHIGLPYAHRLKTLRPEGGGGQGKVAQGAIKRVSRVWLRLLDSLGGTVGNGAQSQPIYLRTPPDPMTMAVPLFSGDLQVDFPAGWSTEGQITIEGSDPLPFNLTALIYEMQTNA